MKELFNFIILLFSTLVAQAQCSSVGVQISFSDTTTISLYHAGFFNIPSGFDNVCAWTVKTFDGEVIHEDLTSGDFNEQSNSLFQHEVPILDSMKATIVITNETEGIICTMNDTIYWEEIEVLPGIFIGTWSVLSNNGGVEEVISSASDIRFDRDEIIVYPSPTYDSFRIATDQDIQSIRIYDINGQLLSKTDYVQVQEEIDISAYLPGLYLVKFYHRSGQSASRRLVKL